MRGLMVNSWISMWHDVINIHRLYLGSGNEYSIVNVCDPELTR